MSFFSKYSVQLLSHVWLFVTPWIAACQASLSITYSWSSLKLTSIESVMPSSHLILCRPLLLLPPIPPSILAKQIFSDAIAFQATWHYYLLYYFLKSYLINCYWSISKPSSEDPGWRLGSWLFLVSCSFLIVSQFICILKFAYLFCSFLFLKQEYLIYHLLISQVRFLKINI